MANATLRRTSSAPAVNYLPSPSATSKFGASKKWSLPRQLGSPPFQFRQKHGRRCRQPSYAQRLAMRLTRSLFTGSKPKLRAVVPQPATNKAPVLLRIPASTQNRCATCVASLPCPTSRIVRLCASWLRQSKHPWREARSGMFLSPVRRPILHPPPVRSAGRPHRHAFRRVS